MSWINLNGKFEEKGMKIGLVILLFILIIFVLIIGSIISYKIYDNQYKKIFGFELQDSNSLKYSGSPTTINKLERDTSLVKSPILQKKEMLLYKTYSINRTLPLKIKDTTKNNAQFNFNNSPVTNSAVGINPTNTNVYTGIKQRHINESDVIQIVFKIDNLIKGNKNWNKKTPIYLSIPINDEEAEIYASEIDSLLKKNGYINVVKQSIIYAKHVTGSYEVINGTFETEVSPTIYIHPCPNVNKDLY